MAPGGSSSGGSFTNDGGRLAALREAAQKLHRNLLKKLQQVEALEAKQQSGGILDPQQMAKLSLKGSLLDALNQLRAGTVPFDDIQALLSRAQAVANKLYLGSDAGEGDATSAGAGGSSSLTSRSLGSYAAGAAGAAGLPGSASALPAAAGAMLSGEQPTGTSSSGTDTRGAGSSETSEQQQQQPSPAAGRKSAKKTQQMRKGDLSMFLTGELEKPSPAAAPAAPAVDADGSSSSSSKPEPPKGPAWGGVALKQAASAASGGAASLRELLGGEDAAAAVGSGGQQQHIVLKQPAVPGSMVGQATPRLGFAAPTAASHNSTSAHTSSLAPVGQAAAKQHQTPAAALAVGVGLTTPPASKFRTALPSLGSSSDAAAPASAERPASAVAS
ncbi:hypothetical protein COO60DRAFT_1095956 [Scenedesmus sp. NREL 46B-D3]|nr:hypothetical protein COO60DRAFT_1095956 [Scenedesmus sp. NREL 46B-D3]